ncbi:hypothetical protein K443DRAFT_8567 [Laccaria amethystina LaAM-08-1]|uniref:Uncharacterized protein n=1 Tax=Laccaria amethystina LaAM-08-1 TaxID=1095629 RepID=A0A0C9WNL4_9AGAR|nr:hypothetical protein K443DRAFT_8567 [Laccaria amethystina LaAM-08-1]
MLAETAGSNNQAIPSSESRPELILGTECAGSLKLMEISMLHLPKTRPHHGVEKIPDAQITSDTTYLHSGRVAGEFFSRFSPRTKLDVDHAIVPHLNDSHTP